MLLNFEIRMPVKADSKIKAARHQYQMTQNLKLHT